MFYQNQPQQPKETYEIPEFIRAVNDAPVEPKPDVNPLDAINNFRIDMFYYRINNLDKLDAEQRAVFIKSNLDMISDHIVNAKCQYAKVLFTPIFLETYFKVLSLIPITPLRKFASNYLYYTFKTNAKYNSIPQEEKEVVHNLFYSIARVVNRDQIRILESIGVPAEYATELSVARNSYTDEIVNAHRVNQIILYSRDPSLFTEQMVIYVYEKLFDQIRYLFMATMFDLSDNYAQEFPDDEDALYYVFSNIELAVLTIANNLPINDINRLLRIYVEKWNSIGRPMVRFSLRVLSADFGRILSVAENLTMNGVYVP